jgi:subtilisin family serine protease
MNRRLILGLAAALAVGACSDQHEPNTDSITPGSEPASSSSTKPINVVTKAPATAAQLAELGKYGNILQEIRAINAVIMTGSESALAAIKRLTFVAGANFDAERNIPPFRQVQLTDFTGGLSTWNLDAVNVTKEPFSSTRVVKQDGSGVYVAILDTGLLPTWQSYFPDERIAEEFGAAFGGGGMDRGAVPEIPGKWEKDVHSHGTHVTSTVIGYDFRGTPINGVAPKATIIPVKVLNQAGFGWSSIIAAGIVYAADLRRSGVLGGSPLVINMSLGGPTLDAVEKAAIDYAVANGVIVVASAGNSGDNGMGFPGAYAPVISAAASGWIREWRACTSNAIATNWWVACDVPEPTSAEDFYITDFSSRQRAGQDLDVAAPGSWVVGPFQVNQGQLSWFFLGGTSMSSPHVAGIVALMAQKKPSLTAAQAEDILTTSAIPLPPGNRDVFDIITGTVVNFSWGADATGAGLATADKALAATR